MTEIHRPDPANIAWNTAYADCVIHAPQQHVWHVLTDFPNYSVWNSFTYDVNMPRFAVGEQFAFTVRLLDIYQGQHWEQIHHIEPPHILAWRFPYDRNPFLNATRYQVLTAHDDGSTYYQTWETFTGAFAPIIKLAVFGRVQRGFDRCARDLKAYCEARV